MKQALPFEAHIGFMLVFILWVHSWFAGDRSWRNSVTPTSHPSFVRFVLGPSMRDTARKWPHEHYLCMAMLNSEQNRQLYQLRWILCFGYVKWAFYSSHIFCLNQNSPVLDILTPTQLLLPHYAEAAHFRVHFSYYPIIMEYIVKWTRKFSLLTMALPDIE